jgi:plastocyanin
MLWGARAGIENRGGIMRIVYGKSAGWLVTAAAAAVIAGCGGGGGSDSPSGTAASSAASSASSPTASASASGTAVTVTEKEFSIMLSTNTFTAGTYTFTIQNQGSFPHNLNVKGAGITGEASPNVQPGGTGQLTVTLQEGSYELWCSVDGHKDRGMDITIQVS